MPSTYASPPGGKASLSQPPPARRGAAPPDVPSVGRRLGGCNHTHPRHFNPFACARLAFGALVARTARCGPSKTELPRESLGIQQIPGAPCPRPQRRHPHKGSSAGAVFRLCSRRCRRARGAASPGAANAAAPREEPLRRSRRYFKNKEGAGAVATRGRGCSQHSTSRFLSAARAALPGMQNLP